MGVNVITRKQLKEKATLRNGEKVEGILNTFELPASGTPVVSETTLRLFNSTQHHTIGPNASSGNWLTIISQSDSQTVANITSNRTTIGSFPQSGRGSTLFNTSRVYYSINLSLLSRITGSITAANIYLPISGSDSSVAVFGESYGLFSGDSGSALNIPEVVGSYNRYFAENEGNKTMYSDFQTPSENSVLTYSLNSTAILKINERNTEEEGPDIVIALIAGKDFNGTAPTNKTSFQLFITSSQIDGISPGYPSFAISTGVNNQFANPYIEFTFTPD